MNDLWLKQQMEAVGKQNSDALDWDHLEKDWMRNKTYEYPKFCPFTIEQILDKNFFPNDQRIALPDNQVSDSEITNNA